MFFELIVQKGRLLLKKVFELIQKQVVILVIFFDKFSFVVIVYFYSFVFQVSNDLFGSAYVVAQTEELNYVLELAFDTDHLLSQHIADFDQNVVFLSEEDQQQL